MSLILSLDSSTTVCSVAIHKEGKLLDSIFISEPRAASSKLLQEAKNLLDKNSIKPFDLKAIAVSSGPGSYTGLRIGTSAAKGLCYALNVPLIAVNSLLVLTEGVLKKQKSDYYCPMLDARRMEVYSMVVDSDLATIQSIEAKILSDESFKTYLDGRTMTFFGDGSDKFKSVTNHPNAIFVEGVHPEAKYLGYLAYRKFLNNDFENLADFEPMYLKEFMIKKAKTVR
jgi:tRNA threonylcarbamoyladenosine biosynthesis protein TsaB